MDGHAVAAVPRGGIGERAPALQPHGAEGAFLPLAHAAVKEQRLRGRIVFPVDEQPGKRAVREVVLPPRQHRQKGELGPQRRRAVAPHGEQERFLRRMDPAAQRQRQALGIGDVGRRALLFLKQPAGAGQPLQRRQMQRLGAVGQRQPQAARGRIAVVHAGVDRQPAPPQLDVAAARGDERKRPARKHRHARGEDVVGRAPAFRAERQAPLALAPAGRLAPQRQLGRRAFLQKLQPRAHAHVGQEAAHEHVVERRVGQRDDAHAQMVRKVGADRRALAVVGRGEVHRLVKAVFAARAHRLQPPQVGERLARAEGQRKEGGVGREDGRLLAVALERQALNAAGLVLVVHLRIKREERALRDAPRPAEQHPPLLAQGELDALAHERPARRGQQKLAHQILEHRARPRRHPHAAAAQPRIARERLPVPLAQQAGRHRVVGQRARLAHQQVVIHRRGRRAGRLDADIEKLLFLRKQHREIGRVDDRADAAGQRVERLLAQQRLQRDQTGDEVARIDRRHIGRAEDAAGRQRIPVVEVAGVLLQPLDGRNRSLDAAAKLRVVDEAEVARRADGQQIQPDVGRRGAVGAALGGRKLEVVYRQLAAVGPDGVGEEAPNLPRAFDRRIARRAPERLGRAPRSGQRPRQQGEGEEQ